MIPSRLLSISHVCIDLVGSHAPHQPEYMEQAQEDVARNTRSVEEGSENEGQADCDGDEDFEVGGEGQPHLKKVL